MRWAGRRVVVVGGSGFLGRSLARYLAEQGVEVVLVSRRPAGDGAWRWGGGDGRTVGGWGRELDGAAGVVNLAGRTVDCVKTPDHCDEILRSRVEATRAVGMPIGLPAPSLGVRLAAPLVLRTDPELALYGRYCVPRRLLDEGFEFRFAELGAALGDLVRR